MTSKIAFLDLLNARLPADKKISLAAAGDNTPAQLVTLQRLIDFPAREERDQTKEERANEAHSLKREMHAHKIACDNGRLEIDKEAPPPSPTATSPTATSPTATSPTTTPPNTYDATKRMNKSTRAPTSVRRGAGSRSKTRSL